MNQKEAILYQNPVIRFKLKFDPQQERLDNFGRTTAIPVENATLTPMFSNVSAHFIELMPNSLTPYQSGSLVYKGKEVSTDTANPNGFDTAIDFSNAIVVEEGDLFWEMPIKEIKPGSYDHLRVSISFQKFEVNYNLVNIPQFDDLVNQKGTLISFLGYNTLINSVQIRNKNIEINESKLQGFWAFETHLSNQFSQYDQVLSGQSPQNTTTVVNPFPNSPIPPGSCVVSGSFEETLIITGNEENDMNITISLSVNNSFEWVDQNQNNKWDIDVKNPINTESVVDMGLRGLKAFIE